ncbi:MAG: hypothetical protein SV487_04020 [Thermodesulfobacteriota bacterium]|nr:hypothetical protein [Thermodesulfobacteriota bacterium]
MGGPDPELGATIIIEQDGRIILPEKVMKECVIQTPGCELWFNKKISALGIKLLRGDNDPPYPVRRLAVEGGGERGEIEAGPFFAKIGFSFDGQAQDFSYRYYRQEHFIEVRLG